MKIAIIGSGNMGVQLSAHLIHYGNDITVVIGEIGRKETIRSKIIHILQKRYSDQFTKESSLEITNKYEAVKKCDLIIETTTEDLQRKKMVFEKLSGVCDSNVIVATNTSSLSVTKLAESYKWPCNFIGCHFFNPVSKMDLVEVVMGKSTTDEVYSWVEQFVKTIDKKPVKTIDSPGFIVNRLLLPQINDAIKLLEDGVATIEDIDLAVKLGLNHPMGPFELADYIGLDVCQAALKELYEKTGDANYKPAETLFQYVSANKLGIKSGEGFYIYNSR